MKSKLILTATLALGGLLLHLPAHSNTLLTVSEIEELFTDTTQQCDQTGKDATCITHTTDENRVIRVMLSGKNEGKRYIGTWEVNRNGLFCITWDGKDKPLCFVVTSTEDDKYHLYLRGYHKATVLSVEPGNPEGLMEVEK